MVINLGLNSVDFAIACRPRHDICGIAVHLL
jgi:hypothetical protein